MQSIIEVITAWIPAVTLLLSIVAILTTARTKAQQVRLDKERNEANADDLYSQINERIRKAYDELVTSLRADLAIVRAELTIVKERNAVSEDSISNLQNQLRVKDYEINSLNNKFFIMEESFKKDLQLYKSYINYLLKWIEDHKTDGSVPLDLEHFNADGTAEFVTH